MGFTSIRDNMTRLLYFTTKSVFFLMWQNHRNTTFDLSRLRQKYFIKKLIGVLSLFILIFGAKNVTIHVNTRLEMVIIIIINEGKRKTHFSNVSEKSSLALRL